uniref:Uncharacterized protein AlNc14C76G5117 n=1 Tax=Albugo laibachii Nc14 TaxID=890382 RepID=F0WER7_9STRA|nr:conserved hypothetical protein [Albugo laibachii Nc14]|eukprot:CCA19699.1 conserved hypothetical protein [Albugo laibachii Nc14]
MDRVFIHRCTLLFGCVTKTHSMNGVINAMRASRQRRLSYRIRCCGLCTSTTLVHSTKDEKWINLMKKTSILESSVLLPLNEKILGPLDRKNKFEKLPSLPFVFLLGNHSSGKSTFINYLLQRQVQSTGVAPTDDGFTIIAPGQEDIDQDGPALINDPDLGFSGLQSFGPALIQRTQLKVRKDVKLNFMLVDSPGMIDSPKANTQSWQPYDESQQTGEAMRPDTIRNVRRRPAASNNFQYTYMQRDTSNRGYEFADVIRWYAERADIILLFFDPDKPGTTGETLSVLTSALLGMDHKLHIVMNKVDQFTKIHDFARAYGSLCWNLSKVIPLKDLPRIYTMCIPVPKHQYDQARVDNGLGTSLKDLDAMREQVVQEVMRAPERRVDNLITNLYDAARLLYMHATILESVRARYTRETWQRHALVASTFLGGNALATTAFMAGGPLGFDLSISITSCLASIGLLWHNHRSLQQLADNLLRDVSLNEDFQKHYGRQLADGDEYVLALWKRILPCVQLSIRTLGLRKIPKIKQAEIDQIESVLNHDIPALRRECAPADTSLVHQIAQMFRTH